MGNPSHSALCSRCILCNVQSSISLTYNTLDYTRSTCLIRKVQQTHEPRVRHFFIDHCNVQYSISLAYHTLDNTRSACSMCNAQRTHLSLGYVTRPQTNATCNPQHLAQHYVRHAQYAMFSKRTWSLSGAGRARISSQTNAPIAGSSSSLISVGTKLCRITKWSLGIIHSFAQKGLHQEHLQQACYSLDRFSASLPRARGLGTLTRTS